MQFVKPIPFKEAIAKLGSKSPVTSQMNSAEWRDVPVALRERAFFSATVESARVLQRGRQGLLDFISNARETLDTGETALKTGSRADFVQQMQDFLKAEGIQRSKGGLTDITSERRLGLIFDVQTRQAHDYGYWKQGQDPAILDEFPAARFIRVITVKEPRTDHARFENEVRLKSDLNFWTSLNKDFGVPWGPWGFGCGHDVEDVDRTEAERLGLIQPGDVVKPVEQDFNDRLEAGTKGLDPDLVAKLKTELGDQIEEVDGALRWTGRIPQPGPEPRPKPQPQPRPSPAPAPAPAPAATPAPTPGTPAPTPRTQMPDISALAQTYKGTTLYVRKQALVDQARTALSIPEPDQAPLSVAVTTRVPEVRRAISAGADIVRRYTAPELVRNVTVSADARAERAHYSPASRTVSLGRKDDPSVAAHELMHAVEHQNPSVQRACAEFLMRRAAGERPESLRALTGAGYPPSERAFKDKWKERNGSPYAGKVYTSGGSDPRGPEDIRFTEVLTMGVERLHADPLEFYNNDRDWFEFVVKTLRNL